MMRDDSPGKSSHSDVANHPEGSKDTESCTSSAARLEFCVICPDNWYTAPYTEIQLSTTSNIFTIELTQHH